MTRRLILACALFSSFGIAQTLSGDGLVKALQQGGYVIVMRHASSPNAVPAGATERQLDDAGRVAATAMGRAIASLKIPIAEAYSSPTQRAMDTTKLVQSGKATATPELGDNGQSMSGGTAAQATWLQKRVAQTLSGTNVLVVTHQPNLRGAFPEQAANVADGEALVFGPGSKLVGRIRIEEWAK